MFVLSVSDAWAVGFPIAVLAIQILHGVLTAVLVTKARRIDTLEADLKEALAAAMQEKLATLRAEQQAPISVLNSSMSHVYLRLNDGETAFRKLREKDTELELKFIQKISELRQFISDTCATKDDLKELEQTLKP